MPDPSLYRENRKKLLSLFDDTKNELIFLKGGSVTRRYDTDFEYPFRQESNFLYLTGVAEPDMAAFFHCDTGEYTLVIPRRDTQYAVWMGYVRPPDDYLESYRPDRVIYSDELESEWKRHRPSTIHCLPSQSNRIDGLGFSSNTGELADALSYCRVIKSEKEQKLLKKAAACANKAHLEVMQAVEPGRYEYEMKALFDSVALRNGMHHSPYSGIFASGPGSAILHYTGNHRRMISGELLLVDAGTEYCGYASDITRTFPVNGTFSPLQADLYDIVLEAQITALNLIRPGNKMEELHLAAARQILSGLKECGLVLGETDQLMEKNIFALFFPHGLGHFLGLDTHDVGGYPKGTEVIDRPGLRFLRARRKLEPGMVITIEPGIYFIPALLKPALDDPGTAKFLVRDKLEKLFDFGGIRIEDNVIVRADGMENLTTAPKTRQDISLQATSDR